MFPSYILGAVAALAAFATAQSEDSTSYTSAKTTPTATSSWSKTASSTTSSTSGPATQTILVGAYGFLFTPNDTTAKVGDILRFEFYPGGHSVARSDFKWPCIPYEYSGVHRTGFWSGTKAPQVAAANVTYDVRVNDTDPIFFYCAAPGSCKDHHMIGVVNARKDQTLEEQLEYAEKSEVQLAPGEPWPSESAGDMPSETQGAGSSNSDEPEPTGTTQSQSSNDDHAHLSPGAIAGIAIGSAAVLVLAAALIYLCGRRGGFDKAYRKSVAPPPAGQTGPMTEQNFGAGGLSANPKSPGQTSFSTYSGAPDADPYRSLTTSPQHPYYNGSHNGSPPPPSAGGPYPGYPPYPGASPHGMYANMGELSAQPQQYQPHQSPVELPTTVGAGSVAASPIPASPPPQYPNSARRDSWTAGEEGFYRPGNK